MVEVLFPWPPHVRNVMYSLGFRDYLKWRGKMGDRKKDTGFFENILKQQLILLYQTGPTKRSVNIQ